MRYLNLMKQVVDNLWIGSTSDSCKMLPTSAIAKYKDVSTQTLYRFELYSPLVKCKTQLCKCTLNQIGLDLINANAVL